MRDLKPALLGLVLGGLTAFGTAFAEPPASRHPRLVPGQVAQCRTCHGRLFEGKPAVHAATDDCTSCHRIETAEKGTSVALVLDEPALCVTCHQELANAVSGKLAAPHAAVADSCLVCHDPHATVAPRLLRAGQLELCTGCHDAAATSAKHRNLLTPSTRCASCHASHGSAFPKLLSAGKLHPPMADGTCEACHRASAGDRVRLQARGQRLCLACHQDPAAAGRKGGSVHGAMADDAKGRTACLACHSPHLGETSRLLVKPGVELCATCHASVVAAAKAKTGHPPAAEECTGCHLPHGSAEPRLLTSPRAELCGSCHDSSDAALLRKHLGRPLAGLDCLSCHSPHGAGQPMGLAANVHPPVLESCETCHEGTFDKLAEGGGTALCAACHSEIGEAAEKAKVPHAALEAGGCVACHNPHAAARPRLVKSPEASCGECHAEKIAGPGERSHGVIGLLGCEACHEPHGGALPKLLRKEGAELCLECHADAKVRAAASSPLGVFGRFEIPPGKMAGVAALNLSADGLRNHPTTGHRVAGKATAEELKTASSTFTGELTCITCHDPHKGKSRGLFQWGAASASEVCLHCHTK